MKKILVAFGFLFLIGCSSNEDEMVTEEVVVDSPQVNESNITVINNADLWHVEMNDRNEDKIAAPEKPGVEVLSPEKLIEALNQNTPEVKLVFERVSGDTAFISIPDSKYLTSQMGSTGAYNYLATVVYNFTELKPVRIVHFNFEEGDHASPGNYTRNDFKRLR